MEGERVEKIWESLKKRVKKYETKNEVKIRKRRFGEHNWWNADCKRKKRNKAYRKWKKGRQGKEEYLRLRTEFREKCKEKEERENRKRIEEEIKNITTEVQIWKFVNLGRKKTRIIEENVRMEDWEKHFLELLKGEKGTDEKTGEKRRMEGDQEEELEEKK